MQIKISKTVKQNLLIFFTMIILFTIVLLSLYPGILTVDGKNQWKQIENNNIIKNHPFFSTFFWWLLSKIWYSPTVLLVFQMILLSIIWTFICYELRNKYNFNRQLLYTILLCFIPIVGSVISLYLFAVTGFRRGTKGPNQYGPDPLEKSNEAIASKG